MPVIADYDNEDEDRLPGGGGRRIGAQSGTVLAEPTKQTESGFVPWDRFVSANQDVSAREAGKISGSVESQAEGVTSDLDKASKQQEKDIASNYVGGQQPAGAFASLSLPDQQKDTAFGIAKTPPPGLGYGPGIAAQPAAQPTTQPAPAGIAKRELGRNQFKLKAPIDPDKLQTDFSSGAPHTSGANLSGAKSLEDQFKSQGGADAWQDFLAKSIRAEGEANALGSESGVQGLVQQGNQTPNSAFDAALISGQGGKEFQDLFKQYGGGQLEDQILAGNESAMQRWQDFMSDVNKAAGARDTEINDATAEANRKANEQAEDAAKRDAQQKQLQEQLDYLKEHFPIPNGWDDMTADGSDHGWTVGQRAFIDFVSKNRTSSNGTNNSALKFWADQIYGRENNVGANGQWNEWAGMDKLYRDIQKMTPAEYQAFMYGVVPDWMGLGKAASGANGGQFWGLGNTGNRTTAETTNDSSGLSPEDQKDWNQKQEALKAYYEALAAIAMAGVG